MGVPGNAACTKGIQGRCRQSNLMTRCRSAPLSRGGHQALQGAGASALLGVAMMQPEEGVEHRRLRHRDALRQAGQRLRDQRRAAARDVQDESCGGHAVGQLVQCGPGGAADQAVPAIGWPAAQRCNDLQHIAIVDGGIAVGRAFAQHPAGVPKQLREPRVGYAVDHEVDAGLGTAVVGTVQATGIEVPGVARREMDFFALDAVRDQW